MKTAQVYIVQPRNLLKSPCKQLASGPCIATLAPVKSGLWPLQIYAGRWPLDLDSAFEDSEQSEQQVNAYIQYPLPQ